ncbi:PilW family protein [Hyalangium versicolor]|uniref:PilW family protein n=1 Tax=Hyalangium versicolor TaxID=2861190 RepID=UPI001CCE0632|nr:prepilin-type N-terminal cleavage/methylation domain-containing protein [Hyalangium versicolor]
MRNTVRSRGFTLLELLVGAAVGAVVLLGISLAFISQAQQYQAHASRRGVQANARQALVFMGRHLRMAGYGVDPDRAILAYDSYNAAGDQQEPGYPDALVVHWRDGLFRRRAASVSSTLISLQPSEPLREPLRQGQILLVMCERDPNFPDPSVDENPPHVFVTVGQYAPAGATDIALDQTPKTSAPNSPLLAPGRFFHEQVDPGFAHPCFSRQPPHVLLVHRAAFFVALYDDDGIASTTERTPYLMMHPGLDMPSASNVQGDGVIDRNDAVPVAEGVEQLQVAYILDTNNRDADKTPLILGVNAPMPPDHYGENWEERDLVNLPHGWFFNVGLNAVDPQEIPYKRLLDHPANIRQVRLTLVSRSSIPDAQIEGDNLLMRPDNTPYPDGAPLANGTIPWRHLENLLQDPIASGLSPSGGHYYRGILRESITPKNLLLNRQFAPINPGGG